MKFSCLTAVLTYETILLINAVTFRVLCEISIHVHTHLEVYGKLRDILYELII